MGKEKVNDGKKILPEKIGEKINFNLIAVYRLFNKRREGFMRFVKVGFADKFVRSVHGKNGNA